MVSFFLLTGFYMGYTMVPWSFDVMLCSKG